MLYSVQNSGGQVYGTYEMPPSDMSTEVWAAELGSELEDILGINGVRDSGLLKADGQGGYVKVPRIVVDIDPWCGSESTKLARVHQTIGRIATQHPPTVS
jgi:hypothetical protein